MSSNQDTYDAPTSNVIKAGQNSKTALRYLLAQRRLYTKSKKWLALRLIGTGLIGVAAPVATFLWADASVAVGAVAGAWIFLGRTTFITLEKRLSSRAAAVQELFDIEVFAMPSLGERTPLPTPEEITAYAGADNLIESSAKKEKLLDWYEVDNGDDGAIAVAICQRTNAAYSSSLLKTTSRVWLALIFVWAGVLIILSLSLGLTLATFLLGIVLPLLPAFLDTVEYWRGIRRASAERETLSREIQLKIESGDINGEDLIVWQTRMYDLRRDAPQVPDIIYGLFRNRNERTMKSVAKQLSDKVRGKQ